MRINSESNCNRFKNDTVKTLLKEILYNSLSQAIIKIFSTPNKQLKIILFTFVLISSSMASYLVISSVMAFLDYGVITTSRTIYENYALFPKITFCNVNKFTTQYAYNQTQMSNLSNQEKRKLGHEFNDILIACLFNLKTCTSSDFTWSYDEKYGNCYTYNSDNDEPSKKSFLVGPEFGLQITLYVNVYEKLLDSLNGLGALILIGNRSYTSFHSNGGYLLSPGFQTNIIVERELKHMLPKPYGKCEGPVFKHKSDLFSLIENSPYAYLQQLCFVLCVQKKMIGKYNCTMRNWVSLYNASQCDDRHSLENFYNIFSDNFINEECSPLCPLECNQTLYKISTSSVQLYGNSYYIEKLRNNSYLAMDFVKRSINSKTAKESIVDLYIFYESLSYTFTTESPQMDWISLMASIGGTLGLFLGVSVFSICEMIEVVVEIFYVLKERNNTSN